MYATANLQNRYKQESVTTASPIDLVIMLYEGCIKQLKLAKILQENNEPGKILECFEKAENIILELVRSLDLRFDVSKDLLELYQFMIDEIVQAGLTRDMERIDPVIGMLTSLCEAWGEAKGSVDGDVFSESGAE
ncbi:MAG: flagellar export chaperone FliS [Christensenella hongkongensis]|uniref:Flagellar secretion chaperone FliS n=1 Tax=Christensenella hongkongensis TaxID=270498 RepID=A0A0M2NHS6_9FIRM|nr:flagellar export chaperone FliS [Christensenella hongkongensis]KKI50501.1 Flagellar biosynthesis protein FliS [Christensenella hongkongensis]MDY3003609.1 flagellar export chaperone FliS [Christensenella hongkongensis]TCW29732.1 flagellar protein FliS [Christensenella hongkongensis]